GRKYCLYSYLQVCKSNTLLLYRSKNLERRTVPNTCSDFRDNKALGLVAFKRIIATIIYHIMTLLLNSDPASYSPLSSVSEHQLMSSLAKVTSVLTDDRTLQPIRLEADHQRSPHVPRTRSYSHYRTAHTPAHSPKSYLQATMANMPHRTPLLISPDSTNPLFNTEATTHTTATFRLREHRP
ncbi:hypothetical protein SARC_02744, partial [Sphaeroforma arctica JP610]